jgi:hypothetical protein
MSPQASTEGVPAAHLYRAAVLLGPNASATDLAIFVRNNAGKSDAL